MAFYIDEEEVWKCPKHPSKRRKSGICPTCLRDRLVILCPECAKERPCFCHTTTSSSSSSASSSFTTDGFGKVGRVSNLIEREPSLRRSRSLAIPFLRSRSRFYAVTSNDVLDREGVRDSPAVNGSRSARSFWSLFKSQKNNRGDDTEHDCDGEISKKAVMAKSRSVAMGAVPGDREFKARTKGKGWFFPSPMKVFRQSKVSKVVHERSPLYRG